MCHSYLRASFEEEDVGGWVGGRLGGGREQGLACFDRAHEAGGPSADDDDAAGVWCVFLVVLCCGVEEAAYSRVGDGEREEGAAAAAAEISYSDTACGAAGGGDREGEATAE